VSVKVRRRFAICFSRPLGKCVALLTLASLLGLATDARAQAPQGATLTVVRGQVAVVSATGSAAQPAPNGMSLGVGDRIATVGRSSALVTFFEGSELELGEDATIILREIRASGSEVHVTVEDVLGSTVNRVQAFVNPNSVYQVQTPQGQVVALIRGSVVTFVRFQTGGTLVNADCHRLCTVEYEQGTVCEGNQFACGVDSKGGVTNDPNYSGSLLSPDSSSDGDSGDGGGGTIGGS
jgi:hypothetical protein